jgi:predicted transcriptional regulator
MTITIGEQAQVEAWLAAEQKLHHVDAQPKGSVTTGQYATLMKCSVPQARRRLRKLLAAGLATREHFHSGNQSGAAWAYTLKNEKKKVSKA